MIPQRMKGEIRDERSERRGRCGRFRERNYQVDPTTLFQRFCDTQEIPILLQQYAFSFFFFRATNSTMKLASCASSQTVTTFLNFPASSVRDFNKRYCALNERAYLKDIVSAYSDDRISTHTRHYLYGRGLLSLPNQEKPNFKQSTLY